MKLTDAQARALKAIREGAGGVVDRSGKVVIRGERTPYDASTWLRLVAYGVVSGERGRLMPAQYKEG